MPCSLSSLNNHKPMISSKRVLLVNLFLLILFLLFPPSVYPIAAPQTWDAPILAPLSNSFTAPNDTPIAITYSETINPASLTSDTFAIFGAQTGKLSGIYSVTDGHIEMAPTQNLHPNEWIYATATTGIQNMIGQHPLAPTVWGFQAGATPGGGVYTVTLNINFLGVTTVDLGDFNGDGMLDIYLGSEGADKIFINAGEGNFGASQNPVPTQRTLDAALGDLDGDGDLDIFIVQDNAGNPLPAQTWLNDGTGNFTLGDSLPPFESKFRAVALGDLDGDGDLDAYLAGDFADEIWLNDGMGDFLDSGQNLGTSETYSVALGDLDQDGDLDAFAGNSWDTANDVWLNDGTGTFTSSGQALGADFTTKVALGDLDGDGDLDAFVGNSFTTLVDQIWVNDGAGGFTNSGLAFGGDNTLDAALGDLEGDGDLDIYTSELGGKIWINEGALNFAPYDKPLATTSGNAFALGDVRGLGRLDMVLLSGSNWQLWGNIDPDPTCQSQCPLNNCTVSCITTCSGGGLAYRLTELSETPSGSGLNLQTFYDVRDQILTSQRGSHYRDLYYTYDPEILLILISSSSLWNEGYSTLLVWQPNLQALVDGQGDSALITAEQVQAATDFLAHLSAEASPALQQTIADELAQAPSPEDFIGMTMNQARDLLIGHAVYIPAIQK